MRTDRCLSRAQASLEAIAGDTWQALAGWAACRLGVFLPARVAASHPYGVMHKATSEIMFVNLAI